MDDGGYYGGGRRGGFGRGGGRGGFQNQNKRKREDYEEDDRRQLLASLMELGDTKQVPHASTTLAAPLRVAGHAPSPTSRLTRGRIPLISPVCGYRRFVPRIRFPQGEQQQASVEERVEDMAVGLRRQLRHGRGQLCQYIVDCAVELGTKTPTYAMLVGASAQALPPSPPLGPLQGAHPYSNNPEVRPGS